MTLPGIITNITAFGAFVDIGVHQDGLVHLSQMSNKFIKDPNEVVKVNQKVMVKVTEVDIARKRIALTMKTEERPSPRPKYVEQQAKPQQPKPLGPKPKPQPSRIEIDNDEPQSDLAIKLAALRGKFK